VTEGIVQQLEDIRAANGAALKDVEAHMIAFAGARLDPGTANAFIETVRADLQRLDLRPGLAEIVEQLNGQ
jgi:hypothetical protein